MTTVADQAVRRRKWPVITHHYSETGWFLPGNQEPARCYWHPPSFLRPGEIGRRTEPCGQVGVWKVEQRELRAISTTHRPANERRLWGALIDGHD